MAEYGNLLALMLDLDARHDDLLVQLEDLDRRVETALQEWLKLDKPAENGAQNAAEGAETGQAEPEIGLTEAA